MKGKGKQAEKDLINRLDTYGKKVTYFRFTDTHDIINRTGGAAPPAPADFIIVANGRTFFAEVKTSEKPDKFPKANLSNKNQKMAGRLVVAAGGEYWYLIYSSHHNMWYQMSYEESRTRKDWSWSSLQTLSLI